MNGLIQGNDVVISFFKNDWVPYFCASDLSVQLSADILPVRTPGAGDWAKNAYQRLSYTINISGLAVLNQTVDSNFTTFDSIGDWLNFANVQFRIAFYDNLGNIKSLQGFGLLEGIGLNATPASLAKGDISIVGDGEIMYFDGLIPCDSEITSITVTGETAGDGIIHIAYTYTGAPYQVKVRVDSTGNWIYYLIAAPIDIPDLAIGSHSAEVIPVCTNGYEGTGDTADFIVTRGLVCAVSCTDITISGNAADPVFDAPVPYFKFRIDSGLWTQVTWPYTISLAGLSTGTHDVEVVPICLNLVEGTGFTKSFSYTSATQSVINFSLSSWIAGNVLQIYIDTGSGFVLAATQSTNGSGSVIAAIGATVKGVLSGNVNTGNAASLNTADSTLSTTLDNQSGFIPIVLQYSFTSNGDTFAITATISP